MSASAVHVPAYKLLAAELRDAIVAGSFPPGRQLPTESELAATHGVSRQTVRQAFSQLVAESLVYRIRGRGTFATPATRSGAYLHSFQSVDELLALSVDTELEMIEPFERRADVDAAGRMRLDSDDVMVGTFLRLHDGVAFCVTTAYLPLAIGRAIRDDFLATPGSRSRATIISLIERYTGVPIAGAHQSITAAGVPAEIANLIDCEPGDPVMRIDRLYYDRNGAFVELAVSHFNPARYSYRVELRRTAR